MFGMIDGPLEGEQPDFYYQETESDSQSDYQDDLEDPVRPAYRLPSSRRPTASRPLTRTPSGERVSSVATNVLSADEASSVAVSRSFYFTLLAAVN